jgi:hypothetical protein
LKYDVVNQIKNLELKNKNEQIYFKILDARLSFVEIARVSFFCRAAEVVSSSNHAKKKQNFLAYAARWSLGMTSLSCPISPYRASYLKL